MPCKTYKKPYQSDKMIGFNHKNANKNTGLVEGKGYLDK